MIEKKVIPLHRFSEEHLENVAKESLFVGNETTHKCSAKFPEGWVSG